MHPYPPAPPIGIATTPFAQAVRRVQAQRRQLTWRLLTRSGRLAKRGLDFLGVALALVMLAPLMALVALLIKLADGGPVLYWQQRVGQHGIPFKFPKFRSMTTQSDALRAALAAANQHGSAGITFKMKNDPRVTRIGRFIRRFSIDELPQLWCVLNGRMSLVGPRPPLPTEMARYSLADRQRLSVKPGLTCIWQVSGRSEIPFEGQVLMDLEYIRNRSLKADLWLLAKTLPAVVLGRGAY